MSKGIIFSVLVLFTLSMTLTTIPKARSHDSSQITVTGHWIYVELNQSGEAYNVTEIIKVRNDSENRFDGSLKIPIQKGITNFHGDVERDDRICLSMSWENEEVIINPFRGEGVTHDFEEADVPLSYIGQEENLGFIVEVDNVKERIKYTVVAGGENVLKWENVQMGAIKLRYPRRVGTKQMTMGRSGTPTHLYFRENMFLLNLENNRKQIKFETENAPMKGWGHDIYRGENVEREFELQAHENMEVTLIGWSPNYEANLRLTYSLDRGPSGKTQIKKKLGYPHENLQFWILREEDRLVIKTGTNLELYGTREAKSRNGTWQVYRVEDPKEGGEYTLTLVFGKGGGVGDWLLVLIAITVASSVFGIYKLLIEKEEKVGEEEPKLSRKAEMMVEALADLRKDLENNEISERAFKELEKRYKEKARDFAR
ncbi:hypothetical protein AKJ43_03110 [candidate division MSBL1 archaeon SCGC-AAA261D19]|uniref:Uncharacterized protein n=1 Tax=candidate division MSBL1 archaeon SCGC-AAA261D19 TaxID=1698273 RepID=A0A133V5S0_9EURY|nr:hypothetical protein AKJ43_03110 [candidate division MSBL1 archaeon SCGC-AAA261D19]